MRALLAYLCVGVIVATAVVLTLAPMLRSMVVAFRTLGGAL